MLQLLPHQVLLLVEMLQVIVLLVLLRRRRRSCGVLQLDVSLLWRRSILQGGQRLLRDVLRRLECRRRQQQRVEVHRGKRHVAASIQFTLRLNSEHLDARLSCLHNMGEK